MNQRRSAANIPAPTRLCSPGLRKLVLRLRLVDEQSVIQLEESSPSAKLLALLAEQGTIDEEQALQQIGEALAVPFESLKRPELLDRLRRSPLPAAFDINFAYGQRCLPLFEEKETVVMALADPLDTETISSAEFILGKRVKAVLAREAEIVFLLSKLYSSHLMEEAAADIRGAPVDQTKEVVLGTEVQEGGTFVHEKVGSESAPVVQLVHKLLNDALEQKASDIHLEPAPDALDVRFRLDGVMTHQFAIPKQLQNYVIARFKIMSGMDITEKRRPQDGRFALRIANAGKADARVSSVPTPSGEKLVIRLLASDLTSVSLEALAMPPNLLVALRGALALRNRLVIVTGPTGSGKSTTLYAALKHLAQGTTNIITIEDPIEYRIEGITQIQVDTKIGMSFASVLRSVLRQDPDIIMVGEMRDFETSEVAFQAAQTGHLVLATLHTNTAASAVVRLKDLGLEPFIVASSLQAVLAQRLVRKLCGACSRPAEIAGSRTAVGCKDCEFTGYKGRTGLYSLLLVNDEIRQIIRRGGSEEEIESTARASGMVGLYQAGRELIERGVTTVEEIERVIGRHEIFYSRAEPEFAPDHPAAKSGSSDTLDDLLGSFVEGAEQAFNSIQDGSTAKKKVLYIDDDENLRQVLSHGLSTAGFEVYQANSALDGLGQAVLLKPDIIVSDLVMPGMDGRELLQQLKASDETKSIPVVMLTSAETEENEIALLQLGAHDFVRKSSSPAVLAARLSRVLKQTKG